MSARQFKPTSLIAVAVVALLIGLEAPAAAQQIAHKIDGGSIAKGSVPGNRLEDHAIARKQLAPLTWHSLSLTNGWSAYPDRRTPQFAIDPFGIVHFKGAIRCDPDGPNCAYAAFTLPRLARPSATIDVPTYAADEQFGDMYMTSAGEAYFYDGVDSSYAHVETDLDGVTFAVH